MKKTIILSIMLLLASCSAIPKNVQQAEQGSNIQAYFTEEPAHLNVQEEYFEFEGYALGKSHTGTFEDWNVSIFTTNGRISGGEARMDASSVQTDIDLLTNHLKSDDFFHAEKYPTIIFNVESVNNGKMRGELTFHGHTEEIIFPVTMEGNTISADFLLNTKPFDMRYVGVDEKVRIKFRINLV